VTEDAAPSYEDVARAILGAAAHPFPDAVAAAGKRTLFNVLAVALGAAGSPQVTALCAALASPSVPAPSGPRVPAAPGVPGRLGGMDAALLTGFAAHLDDFDDTHLVTVIHPGASALGVTWSAGAHAAVPGADLLAAFALGCEIQLRLGRGVSPEHYDRGWHITGTCGVLGAAVTAGLLGSFGVDRLADALRLASLQTLGHREGFGTEVKPFHAGKAAANGLLAVEEVVRGGVTADGRHALPGLGPLLRALAPGRSTPGHVLDGFGSRWELTANTFKPYPCGIVAHPGIDAALLAHRRGIEPEEITRVRYLCHPLVPELMGRTNPRTGLEARFSAVHGVSAGLVRGTAGPAEFGDAAATEPVLSALRSRIELCPRPEIARDAATLVIELAGGGCAEWAVDHARGSLRRPLTDEELIAKAEALAPGRAGALWDAVSRLTEDGGPRSIQAVLTTARQEAPTS
jgi:2-methylcitrate dehydratase PrpD